MIPFNSNIKDYFNKVVLVDKFGNFNISKDYDSCVKKFVSFLNNDYKFENLLQRGYVFVIDLRKLNYVNINIEEPVLFVIEFRKWLVINYPIEFAEDKIEFITPFEYFGREIW